MQEEKIKETPEIKAQEKPEEFVNPELSKELELNENLENEEREHKKDENKQTENLKEEKSEAEKKTYIDTVGVKAEEEEEEEEEEENEKTDDAEKIPVKKTPQKNKAFATSIKKENVTTDKKKEKVKSLIKIKKSKKKSKNEAQNIEKEKYKRAPGKKDIIKHSKHTTKKNEIINTRKSRKVDDDEFEKYNNLLNTKRTRSSKK